MKKLNEKGFAISAILYTMLILTVLLMFLIVAILADRRATLNKLSSEIKKKLDTVGSEGEETTNLLYRKIKSLAFDTPEAPASIDITKYYINDVSYPTDGSKVPTNTNYPLANVDRSGVFQYTKTNPTSTIYYYRGDVKDNYVVFANRCWRIVSTTETGGVKLIYNGPTIGNVCSENPTPASVIYGSKVSYGSNTTYSGSNAKTQTEKFEKDVLKDEVFSNKLEEMKICNDTTGTTWNNIKAGILTENCQYTVSVKVGHLTALEVARAGALPIQENKGVQVLINSYLRINQPTSGSNITYITVTGGIQYSPTPSDDSDTPQKSLVYVNSFGHLAAYDSDVSFGIRPVIALKPEITFVAGGDGTAENPYVIE